MILKSTIYKLCIHRSAELFLLLPHLLGAKDIYIYIYIYVLMAPKMCHPLGSLLAT
jgi:hypothetical protein